jgi:CxxC motif-containing protein
VKGKSSKDERLAITGAECHRGVKYARSEISDPRRIFASTVKVKGGEIELVPVRTDRPIRKGNWKKAAELVKELKVPGPVGFRDILKEDFTEKGINLIATREISEV